ncbi:hypothetical protein [Saccharopolyspora taberi]|uniref:HTH cro/C1-type domain-containing protein n=1 Tax=Saccharopolyspora taberi TaxID=60895 RepID=A0ABN3VNV3_9PSEU
MRPHICVRWDAFDALLEQHGLRSRYAIARYLDLSQPTVNRVLDGKQSPGERFIAAVLKRFDVPFEDIFEVFEGRAACEVRS